jgi:hypothetical protein
MTKQHWQKVAEAHNCQNLTDAFVQLRQLREQLADTWNVLREFDHTGGNESLSECAGVAVESYNNLKHQLAAAQAAIVKQGEFLERVADHMICGSNIADTPTPTEDEWREVFRIGEADDTSALASALARVKEGKARRVYAKV